MYIAKIKGPIYIKEKFLFDVESIKITYCEYHIDSSTQLFDNI